jgi:hypothetical protein
VASRNKKTTMAKLNRETKLRERRAAKQARKDARRMAPEPTERLHDPLHETPTERVDDI